MYLPAHFEEKDLGILHQVIDHLSFGVLITTSEAGLEANHLPFELNPRQGDYGTLLCHVARSNRAWKDAATSSAECLAIFQGPSAYISPNFYPTKQETHQVVPTYNYIAIHAYGRAIVHEDERWLRGAVGHLTQKFEASQQTPWKMGDAPQAFLNEMLKNIVGLEIQITRLEGKWKLNQNRAESDQQGVIANLSSSSVEQERAIAATMRERREKN